MGSTTSASWSARLIRIGFARGVGRQIGQLPAIGRIVGQQRDPLAHRRRDQAAWIVGPGLQVGLIPQHA